MKPKVLLRIAAGLVFIHLLGHGVGHKDWDKPEDPKMMDVVTAMKSYKGEFMGAIHSMADYYNGYSIMIFGLYGMTISLLWMFLGLFRSNQRFQLKYFILRDQLTCFLVSLNLYTFFLLRQA